VIKVWDIASGVALGTAASAADGFEGEGRGAELFRKCSACHNLTADGGNKAGPSLHGLFGRRAGTFPGYKYSAALLNSDIIWSAETIGALFTEGPQSYTPGTKMPLQQVPNVADREALIVFLKEWTDPDH
jgi:cytochrome c